MPRHKYTKQDLVEAAHEGNYEKAKACIDYFKQKGWLTSRTKREHHAGGYGLDGLDRTDHTAMYYAAGSGHLQIVQLLIDNGATVDDSGYGQREKPLYEAVHGGHLDVVKALLAAGANKESDMLYFAAARQNRPDILEALLLTTEDVNAPCTEIDEEYVDDDVDYDSDDGLDGALVKRGKAPLHVAAQYNQPELVEKLLARGANINIQERRGDGTPLHEAARQGYETIASVLLAHDADIEATDKFKRTPLMTACNSLHADVAALLLDHKADIATRAEYDNVLTAVIQGICLIRRFDFNKDVSLESVMARALAVIDVLLTHGMDVDARNEYGQTALHLAAKEGFVGIMKKLLDHGATVDALDERHETPLHEAAYTNNVEAVRELLRRGANPQVKNKSGYTPLKQVHLHYPHQGYFPPSEYVEMDELLSRAERVYRDKAELERELGLPSSGGMFAQQPTAGGASASHQPSQRRVAY